MSQGNFWSFTLCEYPAVNHAYRACCALSCQMNPTGNGKILQSIYLLGLKTGRTASAHLTLQKRLDRPAVCALLHADIPQPTHAAHFKSCCWKNHFKKQRGTVRTIAPEMAPTWIPRQNSLVQHYVLSGLVALWKTVLPLTRSPKSRASMALSWINLDVSIWIEKQWGIMECCSDASVAFWCWFTLKRLFGKQRTGKRKRRKTCKDFLPNLCMYGGNTLSKNSALQIQTYFLWKSFSIFIRIEKQPLPHHNVCPYLYREAWEKNSKKSTSCNSNERPSIMFLS